MTISESSIKILASERLNDDIDGGGFMTGTVVVDGVENNLFLDLSSLDRAQGRVNLRKVYAAVITNAAETYLGAHVLLDEEPTDTAVNSVMFALGDYATERDAAKAAIEAIPFSTAGFSAQISSDVAIGDTTLTMVNTLVVGQLILLLKNGIRAITSKSGSVYGIDKPVTVGLNVVDGSAVVASLQAYGLAPAKLYGCTGLTTSAAPGDLTISVKSCLGRVVPMEETGLIVPSVDPALLGMDPTNYTLFGMGVAMAPIIRAGDMVVIHQTTSEAPQTVTAAQDINLGRTRLADVRVYGNDGVRITTGFTVNKATGHIVFSSVSGYSQPVTIKHRIEDMASVLKLDYPGTLTLSKQISHTFSSDSTIVSSALIIGDMQARAHNGFQLATWASVFADSPTGAAISPDYNEPGNPIVMTNGGAIKERWALVFTNTTQGKIIGEQVGEIGTFNTGTATAPINPATGVPYFSIPAAGWGIGWAIGNTYRFNTEGANKPIWIARSTKPSDPYVGQDKVTIAVRGDIDA